MAWGHRTLCLKVTKCKELQEPSLEYIVFTASDHAAHVEIILVESTICCCFISANKESHVHPHSHV